MKGRNIPWKGFLGILTAATLLIFMVGCEGDTGPAGPAGADGVDGTDGVDGNAPCLDCHNTDDMNAIGNQYTRSGHALGEFVDYAGGRSSCANCHSGNGFIEFMTTGEVDGDINNPEPIGCDACHEVHATFEVEDFALRTIAAVTAIADDTYQFDFGGSSNLCANCHQSRRAEPNIATPGTTFEITSTHYGPHHGAQANVLDGFGFAEIPGSKTYPTTSIHLNATATCVTCHMETYADGEGGHSWHASLAACNDCHTTEDFDYGDVQTDMEALMDELRDLLLAAGVIEWVVEDEAYEPIVGTYPMVQVQAFFNWIGLEEDRSMGVHNPRYVETLLTNSIEAM